MIKIIYDDSCSFCRDVKSILSKFDLLDCFYWIPNQDYDFEKNNLGFDKKKLGKTIVAIAPYKKVYFEYYACRYIMLHVPIFWPIVPLLYFPIISSFLGNIIYKIISRNRYCKAYEII